MNSATSELLPDPAPPVTHVSTPFSIRTEKLRRLLVVAFRWGTRRRRSGGCGPAGRPGRQMLKARDVPGSLRSRSSRQPQKTTLPPPSPAPGPTSTIRLKTGDLVRYNPIANCAWNCTRALTATL